jgi:4-hydroxy-3-polyprenylbenzoate decarboxylase
LRQRKERHRISRYRQHMKTDPDLRAFIARLERAGLLARIARPTSLVHEITEIHRRVLSEGGPALLFERPVKADGSTSPIPILVNLFGTRQRIELGFGTDDLAGLGEMLAFLRHPEPPGTMKAALAAVPALRAGLSLGTRRAGRLPCQANRQIGTDADLGTLPVQWCWPGEPAPLVTWPLVITRAPDDPDDINVGVYRMQVLGPRTLIVRWLAQRGGARHYRLWQERGLPMPVAVVIGADPATLLSAVMPLPDGMSELDFSGVIRGEKLRVGSGITVDLPIPASAEIVVEGQIAPGVEADEGPYGDHTGYYNAVERFPVVDVTAITTRAAPLYLSTFTGRPPDEPSVLGAAMTELFVPLVRRQFPEVRDVHLPPEACSYRAMVVAIDKRYPGQARRVMMGLWSMLPQFSYTKLIIVVDADIDIRSWADVIWAISTRFDASRDMVIVNDTPIDYLDFASPRPGLGGKLGLDATGKLGAETQREWGRPLAMSKDVMRRVDGFWAELGLGAKP